MRPRSLAFVLVCLWFVVRVSSGPSAKIVGLSTTSPQATGLDLRCFTAADQDRIHADGCGCGLKIIRRSCGADHDTGWEAHFFSALNDGAPLWMKIGGRRVSLRSRRPETNRFSFGEGDRWEEEYEGENMSVRVRYRPGTSTCPRKDDEDGCEYFDVAADVFVTDSLGRTTRFRAAGACGC